MGFLEALLNRYRVECTHVLKRPSDEGLRLKAHHAAPVNHAVNAVSHFLRGLFLFHKGQCGSAHPSNDGFG